MPTLTERVNKLEIEVTKIGAKFDASLSHLSEELKENTVALHKLEEGQERQELLIQAINQSMKGDKKLLAVLTTFIGGLIGYIIKMLLT